MAANAQLIELDLSDNALGPIGVEGMVEFIKSPCCYSLQVSIIDHRLSVYEFVDFLTSRKVTLSLG